MTTAYSTPDTIALWSALLFSLAVFAIVAAPKLAVLPMPSLPRRRPRYMPRHRATRVRWAVAG